MEEKETKTPFYAGAYTTLFTLDKLGKIRRFDINFIQNPDITYNINIHYGLLEGKQTAKVVKVDKAKQGRTLLQQVELEVSSLWDSKRNEGYKSREDLFLKAKSDNIEIKEHHTIEDIFRKLQITFNTDQFWRPLPMLAEKWKPCKKSVKYPVLVQPKLNGVRCIASYDSDLQKVVLSSRGGKTYDVPHIEKELEPFFLLNQNLYLDGELYVHGKFLQEVSGEVRKDSGKCADWIEYHLYDCILNKKQIDRLNDLRIFTKIIQEQFKATHIHLVPTLDANTEEDVITIHNTFVADDYEGAIVRDPNAFYQISFRDKCLLKVKEFEDEEFTIAGGEVDRNKTVGESFVFILHNNIANLPIKHLLTVFKARPTGTIREKEIWYKEIEWLIGETVTVRFQERSKDGLPIQAHVRHTDSEVLMNILKPYNK